MPAEIEPFDQALATPPEERNLWQQLSVKTGGWLTPASTLDALSVPAAFIGAMNIRKPGGKALLIGSNLVDFVDGPIARKTKTANDKGSAIDKVSDKLRIAISFPPVWRNNMAPKPLLSLVAGRHLANMAMTALDRHYNDPPRLVEAAKSARTAIFGELGGLGICALSSDLKKQHPVVGSVTETLGAAISWKFFAVDGLQATKDYLKATLSGMLPATGPREIYSSS